MTLLVEMLGPIVSKLVLHLRVMNGDRAVLHQLLDDEVPQRDVVSRRGVDAICGNMKHRRVVDEEGNAVESILES